MAWTQGLEEVPPPFRPLPIEETGEAQSATVERDRKIAELDAWVSDLRAIARAAFYDSPKELEKLGIVARDGSRAKKPEKAQAAKGQGLHAQALTRTKSPASPRSG